MLLAPTISAAHDAIRSGRLTASQLLDAALAQIQRQEEQIHAWVLVDEAGARNAAAELDRAAAAGEPLGPLHGIPIGVKDLFDVAGMPTVAGAAWRSGIIAEDDAPLVAWLQAAGAVIVGKTVTTQLAYLDPARTRNPWNAAHTPGGSSSGSAAAVASGMCLAAIGTQTGGSILRPAAYCGLVGCKPTFGSVPTGGMLPLAASLDTPGPIARCVEDVARMLAVLQGRECDTPFPTSAISPPRFGLVDEYFMAWADDDVQAAIEDAVEKLHAAGAMVEPFSLPASFPQVEASARRLMAGEAAEVHRQTFTEHSSDFGRHIASLVREGLQQDAADLAAAREHQRRFRAEMETLLAAHETAPSSANGLGDSFVLLMPSTPGPAPRRTDTTGDGRFNIPWSFAGLPAVTIPCGLSADGMPIGLQLVARANQDTKLLAAAAWCERVLNFDASPQNRLET